MRGKLHLIAFSTVAAIAHPACTAAEDEWRYEATPYLHAAGLDGTTGVRGVTTHANVTFGDVLSHLDIAFQGAFLAQKGPVSLNFDAEYIRLSDDGSRTVTGPAGRATVLGKLDVTSTLSILEGTAGYRVFDDQTTLDLLAGLRATRLNADLDLKGTLTVGDEVFGASRSVNGTEDWVDAVVGARVLHPVSKEVSLFGYADLGGGGSDFTWQAVAGVNWEYSKGFLAKFGYRAIAWDYKHHGFVWDMRVHGPYAGLGIRF